MRTLGNFLWLVFGGFFMGLCWWLAALLACITIIGLPWARACFNIGKFTFLPFGREAISRRVLHQQDDLGTSPLGFAGNVVWFLFAGLWLAIGHVATAIGLACTLVGIPFAWQHLKLAGLALAPIGQAIVTTEMARLARMEDASATLDTLRSRR